MKKVQNEFKRVTDLGKNEVIHCSTEEEAKAICKLMHEAGLEWCSGLSYINKTNWLYHDESTCYYPYEGQYCNFKYFKDKGYTIHPASDFLEPEFEFGEEVEVSQNGNKWVKRTFVSLNPNNAGGDKHITVDADGYVSSWKFCRKIEEKPSIEITVKINGKEAKLSDISEDTLNKLRELK